MLLKFLPKISSVSHGRTIHTLLIQESSLMMWKQFWLGTIWSQTFLIMIQALNQFNPGYQSFSNGSMSWLRWRGVKHFIHNAFQIIYLKGWDNTLIHGLQQRCCVWWQELKSLQRIIMATHVMKLWQNFETKFFISGTKNSTNQFQKIHFITQAPFFNSE